MKTSDPTSSRPAGAKARSGRVTIASGAHIEHIDLDAFFGDQAGRARVRGAADIVLAGAGALTEAAMPAPVPRDATPPRAARTVALSDGTRITFTAAQGLHEFEPA